jgi:cysteine desulfurase
MSKRIYLDYASLTPIDSRVMRDMRRFSGRGYANPSSIYKEGVAAKKAMESARSGVAGFLHAHPDEIVFVGGGTEANNLVLVGSLKPAKKNGIERPHLVISNIEHSSILELAAELERTEEAEITRIAVNDLGLIPVDELKKAIKPNTVLVSIMTVNNEIGSVQPIREIAKAIRQAKKILNRSDGDPLKVYPLFHTDASQAALYLDLNVEQLSVDLMTLDGGKVYGPRGIGALFVKRSTPIEPIIYGGGQERGLRSGTENVPAIMGLARALELATAARAAESRRISSLRACFVEGLKKIRPDIVSNPPSLFNENLIESATPHILNVSIPGIDNEFFTLQLDARGIAVSTKSSCLRDEDESYVLKAIGADSKTAVRFSFGRFTKKTDIAKALKEIRAILGKPAKILQK